MSEAKPLAVKEPSIVDLLKGVIDKGVTTENVQALDKLCDLYERMENKKAEREFNAAFTKMQNVMPKIVAMQPVPNRDGTVRYKFAPFEYIMEKAQPFLTEHGFSVSFNTRGSDDKRITVICCLAHISGHARANEFAVRIGDGPPGATITQADGAAKTYAKRGALCDALNIVIEKDDDANIIGKPISKEEAESLERRVKAVGANEEAFLKFAGAKDYASIADGRYEALNDLLKRKEAEKKK